MTPKEYRIKTNLTPTNAAWLLGVDVSNWQRWERGDKPVPKYIRYSLEAHSLVGFNALTTEDEAPHKYTLTALMELLNVNITDLAIVLGVDRSGVTRCLTGERETPRYVKASIKAHMMLSSSVLECLAKDRIFENKPKRRIS